MKEQLQTIIASYFRYWGPEVAEMLETTGDYELQKRIVNEFMRIIEGDFWRETENSVEIYVELDKEIKQPIKCFINLYYLDQLAEKSIQTVKQSFKNKGNEQADKED